MVVLVRLSARVRLPSQMFPASRCPTVQPRVGQHSRPAAGMRSLLSDCRWDLGHLRSFLLRYFAHPPDFGARAGEAWPALVWRGLVCCGWGHG